MWLRTQAFVTEIKLVARLQHSHITSFIGVAWAHEADLQAFFEYMAGGDVRSYLVGTAGDFTGVWTREKLQLALQVADALVYLHSFVPALVHRDVKSRNILLSENNSIAKLSDFGVARFHSETDTMTAGVGTAKWLAPEVIAGRSDYSQAADIFALGVILTELDTHELPYAHVRGPVGGGMSEVTVLQMVASGALLLQVTLECPPAIRALATKCLALDPAMRPTAYQVTYALWTIEAAGDY